MNWKEFLRPTWQKAVLFLAIYIIVIFINHCFFINLIRQCTMGSCGGPCPTIDDYLKNPAFNIAGLLVFAIFYPFVVILVQPKFMPIALIALAIALAFSYFLACALLYFSAPKPATHAKRKKRGKK